MSIILGTPFAADKKQQFASQGTFGLRFWLQYCQHPGLRYLLGTWEATHEDATDHQRRQGVHATAFHQPRPPNSTASSTFWRVACSAAWAVDGLERSKIDNIAGNMNCPPRSDPVLSWFWPFWPPSPNDNIGWPTITGHVLLLPRTRHKMATALDQEATWW